MQVLLEALPPTWKGKLLMVDQMASFVSGPSNRPSVLYPMSAASLRSSVCLVQLPWQLKRVKGGIHARKEKIGSVQFVSHDRPHYYTSSTTQNGEWI